MLDPVCHLCEHVNAPGAQVCVGCGIGLTQQCGRCGRVRAGISPLCEACGAVEAEADVIDPGRVVLARRRPSPRGVEPSDWGGLPVLSLDDAVTDEPAPAPLPVPEVSVLQLRDVDLPDFASEAESSGFGAMEGLVRSDSFLVPPRTVPDPPAPFVDQRDRKAARRAAVRRDRMARQAAESGLAQAMPTDVLVVDRDDPARYRLCMLLDSFGFNVQSARSPAQASALLLSHLYLAVFADIDLQDNQPEGGVAVATLAKAGRLPDGRQPALVIMSAQPTPAERVLAALAGSEQFLAKPLSRGDVARVLEACDMQMPKDPRKLA